MNDLEYLYSSVYRYTNSNGFILFKLIADRNEDLEVLTSKNMSKDNVIFISRTLETLPEDEPIVGIARQYNGCICTSEQLVTAHIIDTNIDNAKDILETLFAS